jgi:hypothetical protein
VPYTVDAGACTQAGDSTWAKLFCASSTSLNFSSYTNAQCSGIPIASTPVNSDFSCKANSNSGGYFSSVCVPGAFDPVPPQPYLSQDVYIVDDPNSAGGRTCPPTLGSGVQLYVRQYINTFNERITLNECSLINDGQMSVYVSCDQRDARTVLIEQYNNSVCSGDATDIIDGCRDISNRKSGGATFLASKLPGSHALVGYTNIVFSNAGTLCERPGPASAAAASLSTAGIVGIGAVVGLASATLALVANYAYQRSLVQRSRPADTAPLLHAGVGMVAR